jgi:hypothetical protein
MARAEFAAGIAGTSIALHRTGTRTVPGGTMSRTSLFVPLALVATLALHAGAALAADPVPIRAVPDSFVFSPAAAARDSAHDLDAVLFRLLPGDDGASRRAPDGDDLLTHPYFWHARHPSGAVQTDPELAYDRVDLVRYGLRVQAQRPETMLPRLGGMLAYATGRRRALYGVQFEQPLLPTARFVLGLNASRRTDHGDLQQLDDAENSLLLLVAHEDWRDYFEREGLGAYLSWRVPRFSTVSAHLRSDRYRSLAASRHVKSWWRTDRSLRDNPAIDDGDAHRAVVRLERVASHPRRGRSGLYHWIELEGAGGPLGGDFDYSRAFADVRSVVRLSPATTLTLRGVGGSGVHGVLPLQRQFTIGGVDGLRAHAFGSYHGDRVALAQLEYSIGMQAFRTRALDAGPQVLLFLDTGTAWDHATAGELVAQRFAADGGVGLATADDDLRLTFAKKLQQPDSGVVVTLRLQRPF